MCCWGVGTSSWGQWGAKQRLLKIFKFFFLYFFFLGCAERQVGSICFCFREAPVQPQCSFPPIQPSQTHCRGREGQIPRLQVQHPAEGCQACSAFVCFKSISLKEIRVLWIQFKLSTCPRGCMWSAPERSFSSPKPTSVDCLFSSLCYYQCVFIEFISLFICLRIRLSP